jgi:hypothetical protein
MAKKKKEKLPESSPRAYPSFFSLLFGFLSRRGKKMIALGLFVVALGFWVVTFTDPGGQNWASHLCPFLIVGGYVLIGIGIVIKDPPPPPPNPA